MALWGEFEMYTMRQWCGTPYVLQSIRSEVCLLEAHASVLLKSILRLGIAHTIRSGIHQSEGGVLSFVKLMLEFTEKASCVLGWGKDFQVTHLLAYQKKGSNPQCL